MIQHECIGAGFKPVMFVGIVHKEAEYNLKIWKFGNLKIKAGNS
jgi:hemin uptake protein HemP